MHLPDLLFQRVSPAVVSQATDLPTSVLTDVTGRHCAMHGRVQPMARGMRLAGPAFTVAVRPGDNLAIHFALLLARPGDILVIDGQGYAHSALLGELMCLHAKQADIAGIVVDGAVRDAAVLCADDLPVFACGANPNGPTRALAGRVAVPVSVGGVPVMPGDLIVGDDDGVIAVPLAQASEAIAGARKKLEAEALRRQDISQGKVIYGWLEQALKNTGMLRPEQTLEQIIQASRADLPGRDC